MKAQIKGLDGAVQGEIDLPAVFAEEYRPDLIRKAVIAIQSTRYQPHGTYVNAGVESVGTGWGSGRGASHVPRLHNGSRAVKVPQARGGRAAHPPKVEKVLIKEINKKEKSKARRSAIAATDERGPRPRTGPPLRGRRPASSWTTRSSRSSGPRTSSGRSPQSVSMPMSRRPRAATRSGPGRGKMRGRRFKQKKSLLIVTANGPLAAARNLAGVDAVPGERAERRAPRTRHACGPAHGLDRRVRSSGWGSSNDPAVPVRDGEGDGGARE